jgi:hypothetical protein
MQFNNKGLYGIIAVIVVVIVIAAGLVIYPDLSKGNNDVVLSKYIKISDNDLLSNGQSHIYFISWYGCPIGADNSWVLYKFINSCKKIVNNVELHTSKKGTPGLLFLNGSSRLGENISFNYAEKAFTFTSLYMYNQTMTGSVYNDPIPSSSRVSIALSVLKNNLPNSVYEAAKKWQTEVPIVNNVTDSIATWCTYQGLPMLVTMLIITGPAATVIHFWYMYQPFPSAVSPQTVFDNLSSYGQIVNAEQQLTDAIALTM